jgi:hypothetical protein
VRQADGSCPGRELQRVIDILGEWGARWRLTFAEALRREQVQLDGAPTEVRGFPHWFTLSPMAKTIRATLPTGVLFPDNPEGEGAGHKRGKSLRRLPHD